MLDRLNSFVRTKLYHVLTAVGFTAFGLIGYAIGGRDFLTEWGGAVAAAIAIFALIFKSQGYWVWSIINAGLWLFLFAGELPMLAGLQVMYIIFSAYGIFMWSTQKFKIGYDFGRVRDNIGVVLGVGVLAYAGYAYSTLEGYAGTTWWYVEAIAVLISVLAFWMDLFKYKGNWVLWSATNALFGPLFWEFGLMGPFILTFVYQTFCFIGIYQWIKEERKLAREGKVELVGGAKYI